MHYMYYVVVSWVRAHVLSIFVFTAYNQYYYNTVYEEWNSNTECSCAYPSVFIYCRMRKKQFNPLTLVHRTSHNTDH